MSARERFNNRLLSGARHRSMPLVIPNDTTYDPSTNELKTIPGEKRKSLKLVPETLSLLESIQGPLAVLAIGGPCRTGKSYVLSRVLGSADDFALGHTMDAKTFGIWMGTSVLECDKYTIVLLDTEGIDSAMAKARDDACILVMTVLLSSFFIYNSIGVPKKNDLEKMSHFAKLATSVAVRDVSDPETLDLKNYFPDFLWLLRDAVLEVPPDHDGKPMTPSTYLKKVILKRSNSFDETKGDKIGRAILTVFPTIECMTIPPPSADPQVMRNIVAKQKCLEPRFNKQIDQLIEYLLQNVRAKNGFVEGKLVDGPLLAAMASQFLEAVNNPDAIPCISDTWHTAVEMRCKKVLNQMIKEYNQEMEAKIAKIGLPMEEDSSEDKDPSNPSSLFGLHRSILLQKTELLLKQVGHFISGPVQNASGGTSTFDREALGAELERCTAVFKEDDTAAQVQGQRKKVVTGGELFKFAQHNHAQSRSQCLDLFAELYKKVEEKMQKSDTDYNFEELAKDLDTLQTEYNKRAIGPAKWKVYKEKESFIRSQEENFKRLRGFKKKAFEALQHAAEEKARNEQLSDSLKQLKLQMQKDVEMNNKRIERMHEEHQEEMKRIQEEQQTRMEQDRKKYDDFVQAQLKDMAEITKENREALKEQYDQMFKAMNDMNEQRSESLKVMQSSVAAMERAIENMKPPKPTCFVAGTTVKLSDGKELSIEKQSKGIKVLALGGDVTTITDEFVENRLDAGQKLVGFNDDTPFVVFHHPFLTTEGWKCLDPETAKEENPDVDFKLLQVGDIVFRIAQIDPFLYQPIKIRKFSFLTLQEPTKVYGLHLDGPRSYHANGYAVMANYPVLTKKRIKEGMEKLTEDEKETLTSALSSVKGELTKVLGCWADDALDDMGLTAGALKD